MWNLGGPLEVDVDYCCLTGCAVCEERFDPFTLVVMAGHFAFHVTKAFHVVADELTDVIEGHARWRRRRQGLTESIEDTIGQLDTPGWAEPFADDKAAGSAAHEERQARAEYLEGAISLEEYRRRTGHSPKGFRDADE